MQSTSYISSDSLYLQLPWKTHKPHSFSFPKTHPNIPKTLIFSNSLSASYEDINSKESTTTTTTTLLLPIEIQKGSKVSRYFWDGTKLQLVSNDGDTLKWVSFDDWFDRLNNFCRDAIRSFFLPSQVQGNYIEYVKWKFLHRVFSSALQVLATQAMFRAMGFGFSRSLPSAAALNWVLKDGLGRLSKCIYTSCLASAFDTELKRVRFSTSIMFSLSIGVELLTPFFPRYFLLLATVANIAKQISLACYISTRTAVHRSFAVADNLGEFSAKAQIQTVCFDSLGLILASLLNILCKNNQRLQAGLPLMVYPIFSAIDLYGIYRGLQHVHLQTVTKDRLEIILDTWIELGSFPSPSKVSKEEGIDFPWCKGRRQWPIRIGCVDPKDTIPKNSMLTMQSLGSKDLYFICMETSRGFTEKCQEGILLSLHKDASTKDIVMGMLQACNIRKMLLEEKKKREHILEANVVSESFHKEWFELVEESKRRIPKEVNLLEEIEKSGWVLKNILLSAEEQVRYRFLDG